VSHAPNPLTEKIWEAATKILLMYKPLGTVIEGYLTGGLDIKLYPGTSVENMRAGKFLVVHGHKYDFFCLLTDVTSCTTSDRFSSGIDRVSMKFFIRKHINVFEVI
jgi:hypothetical protein